MIVGGKVCLYFVCEDPAEWQDGKPYETYSQAQAQARVRHKCVVEATFTYDDSDLVDDFREKPEDDDAT